MESLAYFVLLAVLIIVSGLVAISALIINTIVKVKLAKYNSLHQDEPLAKEQDCVWPPPPQAQIGETYPAASGDPPETGR